MARTIWIVLGVIASVVIAWFVVDLVFSVLWFIVKLAVVAVVAVAVFFALRAWLGRAGERSSIER
ncbi:high-affinity Fe2+/Pb2+ permease [Agromyces flavus]|uniref:High-affinity Fe2+/Pb2+ permease n=1 Tax=Agromyces flavus TaxID=589382 RepID=A0A1H1VS80_9MICO|nr:hypothetical protein [Agromyces flavus]MCP2365997.1 high-affinity Fe2+/Pb2+ permease [Agromyces flavus]GGI43793.1 hypothetical protein GCM10010932_01370 [Agromyces flavus]SDS87525.1 hypothetical protein SAMN04489721_2070 [Agromyces flavus]